RRGADILIDFVGLVIDDPDIRAVGGDARRLGAVVHRAGGPRAQERAARVVDIHVAVIVHDPDLVARHVAHGPARSGVAAAHVIRLDQRAAGRVLVGLVLRTVIDDEELRGRDVIVVNRPDRGSVGDRGPD